jgi:ATP/maltotriose-dependent transcriptional regulator MalT
VDFGRGEIARLEGRFEDARRLTHRAVEGFQALGIPALDACSEEALARTEFSAGSPIAALTSLKRTDAILSDLGYRMYRSGTQALLARAQLQLGKLTCARAAVDLAEQLSVPGEVVPMIVANEVRSQLALAAGDQDGAERFAREAVDRAAGSDYLLFEANARLNLARLLSAFGRTEDATAEARQALERFAAKGDRPGAEQTRALLDELAVQA